MRSSRAGAIYSHRHERKLGSGRIAVFKRVRRTRSGWAWMVFFGSHEGISTPPESAAAWSARRQASARVVALSVGAPAVARLQAEPTSAETFNPAVQKIVPPGTGLFVGGRKGPTEIHRHQRTMPFGASLARLRSGNAPRSRQRTANK